MSMARSAIPVDSAFHKLTVQIDDAKENIVTDKKCLDASGQQAPITSLVNVDKRIDNLREKLGKK